jgi:hypothetical protein
MRSLTLPGSPVVKGQHSYRHVDTRAEYESAVRVVCFGKALGDGVPALMYWCAP